MSNDDSNVVAADIFDDESAAPAVSSVFDASAARDDDDDDDAPAASAPAAAPAKKRKRSSSSSRTVGALLAAERERGIATEATRVAVVERKLVAFERVREEYATSAAEVLVARLDRRMLTSVLTAAVATGQARAPVLSIKVDASGATLTMFEHVITSWRSSQSDGELPALGAAVYSYMTSSVTRAAVKQALSTLTPGVVFVTTFVRDPDYNDNDGVTVMHGIWTCSVRLPGDNEFDGVSFDDE